MKKTLLRSVFMATFAVSLFVSCQKQEFVEPKEYRDIPDQVKSPARLEFTSTEQLSSLVDQMKEMQDLELPKLMLAQTKSGLTQDFTSLRESLIQKGLRSYTDAELQEITSEGLTYEPDDYIVDPYIQSILNGEREVQVNGKIYKYIPEGVLICDASNYHNLLDQANNNDFTSTTPTFENGVEFNPIEYIPHIPDQGIDPDSGTVDYKPEPGTGSTIDPGGFRPPQPPVTPSQTDGVKLADGLVIPKANIRSVKYAPGNGDASWLQKFISSQFGLNVVVENNFDNRHRMKARMYCQEYIIYRAVGMTVRMQKRLFGIWWNKKAQEFRYGWTAIELEYIFNSDVFPKLPPPQTGFQQTKQPDFMEKPFPFKNTEITLFNIPVANYDVTTGDANKLIAGGLNYLKNSLRVYYMTFPGKKNNLIGLYTQPNQTTLRVVYPQGEDKAYNDGREVVRWDFEWFSGYFTMGIGYNPISQKFAQGKIECKQAVKSSISRGEIYAAVKYDGQWRAARIYTGN